MLQRNTVGSYHAAYDNIVVKDCIACDMHLVAVDYNAFGRYVNSIDNAVFFDAKQNIILKLVDR